MPGVENIVVQKYQCSWEDAREAVLVTKQEMGKLDSDPISVEEEDQLLKNACQNWEKLSTMRAKKPADYSNQCWC